MSKGLGYNPRYLLVSWWARPEVGEEYIGNPQIWTSYRVYKYRKRKIKVQRYQKICDLWVRDPRIHTSIYMWLCVVVSVCAFRSKKQKPSWSSTHLRPEKAKRPRKTRRELSDQSHKNLLQTSQKHGVCESIWESGVNCWIWFEVPSAFVFKALRLFSGQVSGSSTPFSFFSPHGRRPQCQV